MDQKIYENFVFGKLAMKMLGPVPENFRLFEAGMHPQPPEEWASMKVTGAEFKAAKSGPNKGKLVEIIAGTERTVYVPRADIQACNESELDVA